MRQLITVLALDGHEEDYTGYDLRIGDVFVAHRRYDGSDPDDVTKEISEAVARLLRAELTRTETGRRNNWSGEPPYGPDVEE